MTGKRMRWAGVALAAAGLSGCHQGENPFGLRGRSKVPYVVERPGYGAQPGMDRLHLSGYAGHNYGPGPIVEPIPRPVR